MSVTSSRSEEPNFNQPNTSAEESRRARRQGMTLPKTAEQQEQKVEVTETPVEGIPKGTANKTERTFQRERSTKGVDKGAAMAAAAAAGKDVTVAGKTVKIYDNYTAEHKQATAVNKLIKHLHNQKDGLTSEGIFRISGDQGTVKQFAKDLSSNPNIDITTLDVNDAVGVLKATFKTVAFSSDVREGLIKCSKELSENPKSLDKILDDVKNLKWTPKQRQILDDVFGYAVEVAKNSDKNLMTPNNIAIVLSPSLVGDAPLDKQLEMNKHMTFILKAVIENGTKFR